GPIDAECDVHRPHQDSRRALGILSDGGSSWPGPPPPSRYERARSALPRQESVDHAGSTHVRVGSRAVPRAVTNDIIEHRLVTAALVLHLLHGLVDRLLHAQRVGTLAWRIVLQGLEVSREEGAGCGRRPELLGEELELLFVSGILLAVLSGTRSTAHRRDENPVSQRRVD